MSLVGVPVLEELEKPTYHLLSQQRLFELDEPEAMFERGNRIRQGISAIKDEAEGWKPILVAAQQGHPVALALCFQDGKGTAKDEVRAFELYCESAARGHPTCKRATRCAVYISHFQAQFGLGWCYEQGRGVAMDKEKAAHYYRLASLKGQHSALNNLGTCYFYGNGTLIDYREAAYWFRRGACCSNSASFAWLGYCYERGSGVEKNEMMAACMYRVGADLGNQFAKNAFFTANRQISDVCSFDRLLVRFRTLFADWFRLQDEKLIVDVLCNQANQAFPEVKEIALEWLCTQHYAEVELIVSACFRFVEAHCDSCYNEHPIAARLKQ
jgi:hypothetical protein